MCTHVFVLITHGIIIPIIIPTYNAHPYFSLKNLDKKVHIIHGKIWQCSILLICYISLGFYTLKYSEMF